VWVSRLRADIDLEEGYTVIDVDVPQSEMLRYSTDLRSLTQGKGSYSMEFDHYDQVPAHMSQKVVEDAKRVTG
jgi:elongation factor G